MTRVIAAIAAAALCGCITPYGPMGYAGGYQNWSRGLGRHHIEVRGNAFTPASTLRYYFNARALELCHFEGYESYEGDPMTEANTYQTSPNYYEVAPRYGGGAYVYERGGMTVTKFGAVGDIVCVGPLRPPATEAQPQQ